MRAQAVLMTEDGRVFPGETYGAAGETFGEVLFNTGMTGYQETLTDPSYHRQIVVMTSPHIGNTGVNNDDDESHRIWVAGFAIREATTASNWRATAELEQRLIDENIVGICGIDTRALTRHITRNGAMRAVISTDTNHAALLQRVRTSPEMIGADLVNEVTTRESYVVEPDGEARFTIAALDLGMKRNTPRSFQQRGVRTHVLPAHTTFDDIAQLQPDGVFLSNGPGDPATAHHAVELTRIILEADIPIFGICFGHQILSRALGLDTYKLTHGHHGINQPVQETSTQHVTITAHNHGFAVQAPETDTLTSPVLPDCEIRVTHRNLNDHVLEGCEVRKHGKRAALSVQYHPEAAAGTHDAHPLFDHFLTLMELHHAQTQ